MKILFIINDAPYGSEKAYNAFRLAMTLQKEHSQTEIFVFLMADAVTCALPQQSTPQGYYNVERMVKAIIHKGGQIKLCGSCCEARGLSQPMLVVGTEVSTMSQLAQWVVEADKVLAF
jgi:uncharacterized protein involved in oxidation of intracellular sulfur